MRIPQAPQRRTNMKYDFAAIEKKWQEKWEAANIFHAEDLSPKKKFYGLV